MCCVLIERNLALIQFQINGYSRRSLSARHLRWLFVHNQTTLAAIAIEESAQKIEIKKTAELGLHRKGEGAGGGSRADVKLNSNCLMSIVKFHRRLF